MPFGGKNSDQRAADMRRRYARGRAAVERGQYAALHPRPAEQVDPWASEEIDLPAGSPPPLRTRPVGIRVTRHPRRGEAADAWATVERKEKPKVEAIEREKTLQEGMRAADDDQRAKLRLLLGLEPGATWKQINERMIANRDAAEWIPTSERLPEPGVKVAMYFGPMDEPEVGWRKQPGRDGHWTWVSGLEHCDLKIRPDAVTHWHALPASPSRWGSTTAADVRDRPATREPRARFGGEMENGRNNLGVYVNSAEVKVRLFDLAVEFGLVTDYDMDGEAIVEPQLAVILSPQHAKAFHRILGECIADHERTFGSISVATVGVAPSEPQPDEG